MLREVGRVLSRAWRRTHVRAWGAVALLAFAAVVASAQETKPPPRPAPPAAPSTGSDPTDAERGTLVEGGARRFAKQGVALDADLVQVRPDHPAAAGAADDGCIVCDGPAGADAIRETWKGRTVTICRACGAEAWRADRDALFAKLQARGVLFDEQTDERRGDRAMASGWMWFGIWALAGVVCAAAASYVALTKGIAPLPWMLAALAFNVVPLALVVLKPAADLSRLPQGVPSGLAKIATTRASVACVKCGAANHPTATRCAACGTPLAASGESEAARVLRSKRSST
jgi:ribosomal protein L37E